MKKATSPLSAKVSRRHFLAAAGAAIAFPTIVPSSALGLGGKTAASNRITMGVVGWGMMGPGNTRNFLALPECQVVAACDIDKNHLKAACDTVNDHYKNKDCKAYHDYKELMARRDIDAVMIAVPDHWHALLAIEAANNKKDIYGEKPLAKTVAEQQAIVRAVERNGRIWQTGSWQRSESNFHRGAEIARNGLIGKLTHVEVGLPAGHTDFPKTEPALLKRLEVLPEKITDPADILPGTAAWNIAVQQPPPELDYETWIGASRMQPYIQACVHMNWRWNYNTGGGQLLDWIGHHGDIAHWGMGFDRNGPSEIEGAGEFPAHDAMWNTCTKYKIELKYPENITMTIAGGHPEIKAGTKWIGTDGWVWVERGNKLEGSNEEWTTMRQLPDAQRKIKLYESSNHQKNFLDCVKSRKLTIAPVQTAHHSAIPGHLSLIAMLTGRKIYWDVASERILNDPEASAMLTRPYRLPYKFPASAPSHLFQSPKAMSA